jgi:5-methyltetrahydrofolate--homocysteine methyltransferase
MAAGLTCAITNPLVPEVRKAVLASDLLLGRDEYAMRWIRAYRAEQAETRPSPLAGEVAPQAPEGAERGGPARSAPTLPSPARGEGK